MKAKHFKKIRGLVKYYEVQTTSALFGFTREGDFKADVIVIAKNDLQAAQRAYKRGLGIGNHNYPDEVSKERWARYRVKEQGKSNHWRNINYFS